MTRQRYEELNNMTMEFLLKSPSVSSDEFNFLLKHADDIDIEFDD